MPRSVTGPEIERLIHLLSRLPGLGPRSARRAALHLIRKKDELLVPLAEAMDVAVESIVVCSTCGNIDTTNPCIICSDPVGAELDYLDEGHLSAAMRQRTPF